MTLYSRIEKILKYRVHRTLTKGFLKKQNFENLFIIFTVGFILVFISGLPGITERNMPTTILFFVINLIYATSMFFVLRNIEKKGRDTFMILVGMAIIILTLIFNIWISLAR